jgi:hypothetical protein
MKKKPKKRGHPKKSRKRPGRPKKLKISVSQKSDYNRYHREYRKLKRDPLPIGELFSKKEKKDPLPL